MTISEVREGSKQLWGKIPSGLVYTLILLLGCTGSFGLGLLASDELLRGSEPRFQIEEAVSPSQLPAAAVQAISEPPEALPEGGQYVASKNGTRYYLPWCGGAKQIKEENKVWFTSKEDAERAGYTAAKNCKGI